MSKNEQGPSAEFSMVAAICEAFESDWSTSAEPPDIRPYLERAPDTTIKTLFGELLVVDCRARRSRGEAVSSEEYAQRFPEFSDVISERLASQEVATTLAGGVGVSLTDTESMAKDGHPSWEGDQVSGEHLPTFDHYRVGKLLGQGGMGAVHEATDTILNRVVAIKTIHPNRLSNTAVVGRFLEEAQIASQLQHPGICPIYAVGRLACSSDSGLDGASCIAMKKVEGVTFADALRERSDDLLQDQSRWLDVFTEVCQAVGYAHAQGVIHRDLKPQNVMLGEFGEALVMDWGLGKLVGSAQVAAGDGEPGVQSSGVAVARDPQNQTQDGDVVGTLAYMPPEQAKGDVDAIDARSDVFSLGSILCEILTGKPAYAASSTAKLLEQTRSGDLEETYHRLNDCGSDAELQDLALACLTLERERRPASAKEVADRVESYRNRVAEQLRNAKIAAERERGRRAAARWRLGVLAIGITTVLIIAFLVRGRLLFVQQLVAEARRADSATKPLLVAVKDEPWNDRAWERLINQRANALTTARRSVDALSILELVPQFSNPPKKLSATLAYRAAQTKRDQQLALALREIETQYTMGAELRRAKIVDALMEYGIDLSADNAPTRTATLIHNSQISDVIFGVLDTYLVFSETGPDSPRYDDQVLAILREVDPHPQRTAFRESLLTRTLPPDLVEQWRVDEHPHATTCSLGAFILNDNPQQAITLLQEVLARDPREIRAHSRLARAHEATDPPDLPSASRHYHAVAILLPESAMVLSNLSVTLRQNNDLAGALLYAEKAVELDPQLAGAHHNVGIALKVLGRLDAAEASFLKAIKLGPDLAAPHVGLGGLREIQKNRRGAIEHYRKALELEPDNSVANKLRYNIAVLGAQLKDYPQAAEDYREAIRHNPSHGANYFNYGNVLVRLDRVDEAVAAYQKAIALGTDTRDLHHNLGLAHRMLKDPVAAIDAYRNAVRCQANDLMSEFWLAQLSMQTNQHPEAIQHYQRVLELSAGMESPDERVFRSHVGLAAMLLDAVDIKALSHVQAAVELSQHFPDHGYPLDVMLAKAEQIVAMDRTLLAVLRGEVAPSTAQEWLSIASYCRQLTPPRHDLAANMYQQALDLELEWTAEKKAQIKFAAACSAVLAGHGKLHDPLLLDQNQRQDLRDHALTWLSDDLADWRQIAAAAKDGDAKSLVKVEVAVKVLESWQQAEYLACVREPDQIVALQEHERQAWSELWDGVDQVLQTLREADD